MRTPRNVGTTALDYFKAAEGHYRAAKILVPHIGLKGSDFSTTNTTFLAFYNVLGFAIELYLKAFLQSTGHRSDELSRKPFGHNLQALFDEALKDGLQLTDDTVRLVIMKIGGTHGDYTYRYLKEGAYIGYFPEEMHKVLFRGLDNFDAVIRAIIVPAIAQGSAANNQDA